MLGDRQNRDGLYDARTVANFIIALHASRGEKLTQLRLYKLLYFCHGWFLVEFGKPLVWNAFEAWERGPVIKAVRDCFRKFGANPITEFAAVFDFRSGQISEFSHSLNEAHERFVTTVVDGYRGISAGQLSEMTHGTGSPWDHLWRAGQPIGRFGLRMKNHEILTDFLDIAPDARLGYNPHPL